MGHYYISRRNLLKQGLTAISLSIAPIHGFSVTIPVGDLDEIVDGYNEYGPSTPGKIGQLSEAEVQTLVSFSDLLIQYWGFKGMEDYSSTLKGVLGLKTNQAPSYLEEYKRATSLIRITIERIPNHTEALQYLLFANRGNDPNYRTRLGRAQRFVFDEIVNHCVANGGFRRFGFVNYKGFIGGSLKAPDSYRR